MALLLGLLAAPGLAWWPLAVLVPVIFFLWLIPSVRLAERRNAKIAAARHGESICEFARSFNCRVVDTWIIRAVHAEISSYCEYPIRSSDLLVEDLHIDGEDLEDSAVDIAKQVGLSLEQAEENPLFNKVRSLADLVMFFHHLPQVAVMPPWRKPEESLLSRTVLSLDDNRCAASHNAEE